MSLKACKFNVQILFKLLRWFLNILLSFCNHLAFKHFNKINIVSPHFNTESFQNDVHNSIFCVFPSSGWMNSIPYIQLNQADISLSCCGTALLYINSSHIVPVDFI